MRRFPAGGEPDLSSLVAGAAPALGLSTEGWDAETIQADGSDRRFYRVRKGTSRFIALVSPRKALDGLDENDSYFRIGKHLHGLGVPVPRIVWGEPEQGRFLMQDVGDRHLQWQAQRGGANAFRLYGRALQALARMHERAPRGFDATAFCFDHPVYDPSFVYSRELEYFRKAFLVGFLGLDVAEEDLRRDFEDLAERAGVHGCTTIIHRDFQSRNVMVHGGRLWIIDFQGMRLGPPAYDLASLLLDPYVMLPGAMQERLVELYWSRMGRTLGGSHGRFRASYAAVRLCRNMQALGAYGFLGKVKGKTRFCRYIPGAWRQLREWVLGPCRGALPRLERWMRVAQKSSGGLLDGTFHF